jgi:hypothetical protein
MRFARRLFVLGQPHDLFNFVRRDPQLAATPFAHLTELGQPFTGEPASPGAHRGRVTPTAVAMWELATPSAAINNTLARFTFRLGRSRRPGQHHQ